MAYRVLKASLVFLVVRADDSSKTCDDSGEDSCLMQSAMKQAEVNAHKVSRCAHLQEAIDRQAKRDALFKKVGCMGGRANGEPYCAPGTEVDCPGPGGEKCGLDIDKPCCKNPCPGVEPYGNDETFPCPSNPNDGEASKTCKSQQKVEDCINPCPNPSPTPVDPTPSPTPKETWWQCSRSDIDNMPNFKQTPSGYTCSTGSTCYSATDIEECTTKATCYAKGTIATCDTDSRCCAATSIGLCKNGATCYAPKITKCEQFAKCATTEKGGKETSIFDTSRTKITTEKGGKEGILPPCLMSNDCD